MVGNIVNVGWATIKSGCLPITDFIINAPQMHCTENSKQIFLEIKLRGLVPNFCIHVSVSDFYSVFLPSVRKRNTAK